VHDAGRYTPLNAGIVHFFGYGQSLSQGFYGEPVLSTTQPYDTLMIGQSTRAAENQYTAPATTTWIPLGPPGPDGTYPFAPMIATVDAPTFPANGETPGEAALNHFRHAYLKQLGLRANPATRFVLTNCGIDAQTIAELSKGANPDIYNRLIQAAQYVRQTAASMGLTYQVGGMIWTQGESDVTAGTSTAAYLASLQQLQADFLTDVVQGVAVQPAGTVIPWFCHQPASSSPKYTIAVQQALLDWSTSANSDCYLAGPVYPYPDYQPHLTANGYRWHGNQVGKAMTHVLLDHGTWRPLHLTSATWSGTTIRAHLHVPYPPLQTGEVFVQFEQYTYPQLGFTAFDSAGPVPIVSAGISGDGTVRLEIGRTLEANPMLQSANTSLNGINWGTNLCDSDATVATDPYVYTVGVQQPGEDIATWNGAPLIGEPYPLNNYLAVGAVPILPD
jgi:hypothetical protein